MNHFKLIQSGIDPQPFRAEIASIDGAWDTSTGRQDKIDVQREALSIPLRGLRKSAIGTRKRRDVHESRWTSSAIKYPLARRFLEDIAAAEDSLLSRARIVCLPAGRRVYPHIDQGAYYRVRNRYHLVLRSASGSWLKAGEEEVRMKEGELWWFDNNEVHEAHNDGDRDRIHLIFDLLPCARAAEVFGTEKVFKCSSRMAADSAVAVRRAPRADFRLVFRPAQQAGALACWLAVPRHTDPAAPPLVAIHGIRRGAQEQAVLFAERAAALGRYVIAPLFDVDTWPTYQRLGRLRRADLALLDLLQQLQGEGIGQRGQIDLFGFSGGAQFAHRFAMLHPHLIGCLNVAAAGWYTFPDAAAYPYGLGERAGRPDDLGPPMQATLDGFLRLPIRVYVGSKDNVPDPNTRDGEAINRQQGHDRSTRAARWTDALILAATHRGIVPRIALSVLPGCGHNFRRCIKRGELAERVLLDHDVDASFHPLPMPYSGEIFPHRLAVRDFTAAFL